MKSFPIFLQRFMQHPVKISAGILLNIYSLPKNLAPEYSVLLNCTHTFIEWEVQASGWSPHSWSQNFWGFLSEIPVGFPSVSFLFPISRYFSNILGFSSGTSARDFFKSTPRSLSGFFLKFYRACLGNVSKGISWSSSNSSFSEFCRNGSCGSIRNISMDVLRDPCRISSDVSAGIFRSSSRSCTQILN